MAPAVRDDGGLSGPHRRFDPLGGAWVLVSSAREQRPWQGDLEISPSVAPPAYEPTCYLCPGNGRAGGRRNPGYVSTYVFENDFPALVPRAIAARNEQGLHIDEEVSGTARVLCFSPRHDRSLASMDTSEMRALVELWAEQTRELGALYRWVQIFENRGAAMGASSPHPHGQVWAASSVPTEAIREDSAQRAYFERTGRVLLDDVRDQEVNGQLVVEAEGQWLALVPYWAAWPFETLLIGPPNVQRMDGLDDAGRNDLGALLSRLVRRYDALFGRPFPYSMGWHGAPFPVDDDSAHWRLHGHVYPPLLHADQRKFMVGYELLSEPQRDLTPEEAAARLLTTLP
jgi:UDPglucose--hexose-1-phosphate uridylyltransferase